MSSTSRTKIEELVLKFQQGEATFEELWARSRRLFNACLSREMSRRELKFNYLLEPDEVVSYCMEAFYEAAKEFDPNKGAFSTLLYKKSLYKVMTEVRYRTRPKRNCTQALMRLDYVVNDSSEVHELIAGDGFSMKRTEVILAVIKRVIEQSKFDDQVKRAIWLHLSTGKALMNTAVECGTNQTKAWRALDKLRTEFKAELEKVGI